MGIDGTWNITLKSPMGAQDSTLEFTSDGSTLTGTQAGSGQSGPISNGSVDGDAVSWSIDVTTPMPMTVVFTGKVDGDSISGEAKAGMFPPFPFSGSRA